MTGDDDVAPEKSNTPMSIFASPMDADGNDPDQLMSDVVEYVTRQTHLTKDQSARFKDIFKHNASRLDMFMQVMAIQRTRLLQQLMGQRRVAESLLFGRANSMSTEELLHFCDSNQRATDSCLAFIKAMAEQPQPQFVREVEQQLFEMKAEVKMTANLDPARREDLRSLMQSLTRLAGQNGHIVDGSTTGPDTGSTERAGPEDV